MGGAQEGTGGWPCVTCMQRNINHSTKRQPLCSPSSSVARPPSLPCKTSSTPAAEASCTRMHARCLRSAPADPFFPCNACAPASDKCPPPTHTHACPACPLASAPAPALAPPQASTSSLERLVPGDRLAGRPGLHGCTLRSAVTCTVRAGWGGEAGPSCYSGTVAGLWTHGARCCHCCEGSGSARVLTVQVLLPIDPEQLHAYRRLAVRHCRMHTLIHAAAAWATSHVHVLQQAAVP